MQKKGRVNYMLEKGEWINAIIAKIILFTRLKKIEWYIIKEYRNSWAKRIAINIIINSSDIIIPNKIGLLTSKRVDEISILALKAKINLQTQRTSNGFGWEQKDKAIILIVTAIVSTSWISLLINTRTGTAIAVVK